LAPIAITPPEAATTRPADGKILAAGSKNSPTTCAPRVEKHPHRTLNFLAPETKKAGASSLFAAGRRLEPAPSKAA
jgi:hypothetical protein